MMFPAEMAENSAETNIKTSASGRENAPSHFGAAASAGEGKAAARHNAAGAPLPAKQAGKEHLQTGAEQIPVKRPFPPFDTAYYASSLLWLAVTFGFFYIFMARVVLPRIGGILESRRDRIAADLDQAARMKAESDAAVAAYQKSLAAAREKAKDIARAAAEEARAKAAAERNSAEADMQNKLAQSERQLAAARDAALKNVDAMAEAAAADIVEKLSGKKADNRLIARAVAGAAAEGTA